MKAARSGDETRPVTCSPVRTEERKASSPVPVAAPSTNSVRPGAI